MTRDTSVRLELAYPLGLVLYAFGNAIAIRTCSGELVFPRYLNQGEPVSSGIIVGRSFRTRCERSREVEVLSGGCFDFGGVHQAITAHPNVVVRLWKVGQNVSSTIVGHDDFDESRG